MTAVRERGSGGLPLVPLTIAALLAAIAGTAAVFVPFGLDGPAIALRAIGAVVAPSLLVVVIVALLQRASTLQRRAARTVVIATGVAVLAGALAQISWGVGFDAADAGLPQPALAEAFVPLLLTGLLAGVLAAGVLFDRVLRDVRPAALRLGLVLLLAVVSVPAVGLALLQPTSAVAGAIALLVLVLRSRRPAHRPSLP